MISRFARLILFLIVLLGVLYIVLLNREPVTVHLGSDVTYQAMGGVVLIVVFSLGLIAASLVGAFFGMRSYFRERSLQSREKQRQALFDGLLTARSYAASGNWTKARYEYEQLIKRHTADLISRVELSKVIELQGDPREALRILDSARSTYPENVEVLLRAAELNIALRNRTAAIDNLALVLLHQPNARAATMARDLSEELERYDDALEYQERLDSLGGDEEEGAKARGRIKFKKLIKENEATPQTLKDTLTVFVKKERSSAALEKLAELEQDAGRKDAAAQLLSKVAREERSIAATRNAVTLWIELNQPQQALATARAVAKETEGSQRLEAEVELGRTYIALNMLDEARNTLSKLSVLAAEINQQITPQLSREALLLEALLFVKLGEPAKSEAILKALTTGSTAVDCGNLVQFKGQVNEAPAPRLSTM